MRRAAAAMLFLWIAGATGGPAATECVSASPLSMRKFAPLVFRGRLVRREPLEIGEVDVSFKLTFDVSHVWKGTVRRTAVLYQLPSLVRVNVEEKQDYVVFAQPLDPEHRRRFGLAVSAAVFAVPPCSGAIQLGEEDAIRLLGPSRPAR